MNVKKQFYEGLITQNPVLIQLLGMCSTMAITTTLFNGIGMGLSVTLILTCCNIVIAMLRKVIPSKIRIAAYVVVIAGFVTIVDLLIQAYIPALTESLGVFIPLIVVNCIILGRAEAFASKNTVLASTLDGIFQGIGYTVVLIIICVVREFLGSGSFGAGILNGGAWDLERRSRDSDIPRRLRCASNCTSLWRIFDPWLPYSFCPVGNRPPGG